MELMEGIQVALQEADGGDGGDGADGIIWRVTLDRCRNEFGAAVVEIQGTKIR